MQPENYYFGGGATETAMHPLVVIWMIIVIVLVLGLPRKRLIGPFLATALLIPMGQVLVVGGVHLFVLRFVILFGCARMIFAKLSAGGSIFRSGLNGFDAIFVFWALYHAFAFLVQFSFLSAALVNQAAGLLDVLGSYFFLRFLIQDGKDIRETISALAVIAAIIALCMLNERFHNQNVFGYLGGFRIAPEIRDGAIRAQGPFSHPILAGCFGGTLLPLFFWLWRCGNSKTLAIVGMVASTAIVFAAASSTPLMAYGAGIIAVCFWPMRRRMRIFRWAIVIVLLGLHLVMKAPVWYLIARVDLTGASSGYHRATLVDMFFKHYREWWLIGTTNNANWAFDMWDVSDTFVAEGISGGLVMFICFIVMIAMYYRKIGKAMESAKGHRKEEWYFWLFGCALTAHMFAFFGICYFDHTQVAWFALMVMINVATGLRLAQKRAAEPGINVLIAESPIAAPPSWISKEARDPWAPI